VKKTFEMIFSNHIHICLLSTWIHRSLFFSHAALPWLVAILAHANPSSPSSPNTNTNASNDNSNYWELTNTDLEQLLTLLEGSATPSASKKSPVSKDETKTTPMWSQSRIKTTIKPITTTQSTTTTTTTTTPETSSTKFPFKKFPVYERRSSDISIDEPTTTTVRSSRQPDNTLAQQMSLINALLTNLDTLSVKLAEKKTTTTTTTEAPKLSVNDQSLSEAAAALFGLKIPGANTNKGGKTSEDKSEHLALLTSLFNGKTAESKPKTSIPVDFASLLGLGKKSNQNKRGVEPEPTAAEIEALSMLLGASNKGQLNGLSNFKDTGAKMQGSASDNQMAELMSLLGNLGSLAQQPAGNANIAAQATNNNNLLASLLGGNQKQQTSQSSLLGSLFSASSPQPQSPFNVNQLFGGQSSPASLPKIPGLGLLSTVTSLGSSLINTVSNVLGATGTDGKPQMRGKGKWSFVTPFFIG